MPRLSNQGRVGMGIAGIQGSVDGAPIPELLGPYWITDDHVVCIHNSDNGIWLYNPTTGARAPLDIRAANELAADGNVFAAWLANYGLYSSTGLHLPKAGLLDVGPDGAIGYIVDRQNDVFGCNVRELDGTDWQLTTQPIAELQLLGEKRAIWRDFSFNFHTTGIPQPITLPGVKWHPHAVQVNGEWWISYLSKEYGLVLHPFNSTIGYQIRLYSDFIYHPDMIALIQNVIRTVWSVTNGEGSGDYIISDTNIVTQPRVQLLQDIPIPAMNKKCWVGWFEFNQPPPEFPPGNALVKIRYDISGNIVNTDDIVFAEWIDGISVLDIEEKCAATFRPCVAYWDGRNWPRWPELKPKDWLGLYAYCFKDESPFIFKANMQLIINMVPLEYTKIALICQCYTSNASLTTNLEGLVSVYAELARDNPRINMLLIFSDQNRATGLNDHPELRPLWEELMEGVTGMPDDEFVSQPLDTRVLDTLRAFRPNYPTPMGARSGELLNDGAAVHKAEGYGLERKDGGNVVFVPGIVDDEGNPIPLASDIIRTLATGGWDVFEDAEGACKVKTSVMSGPVIPEKFVLPVGDIPPSDFRVELIEYDTNVHRGDPKGMLIRFDVTSANPVIRVDLELLDDGEPSISIMFLDEPRRDGRYCRALAFKPVVNGDWTLRVTATDNEGNVTYVDGTVEVHVEP